MKTKKIRLTSFSHTLHSDSFCIRPEKEQELLDYLSQHPTQDMLPRGAGLSYNDSCLNKNKGIIDSSRFNHFIHFDKHSGLLICQGGVPFRDLFLLDPEWIPPVIPGTLQATVAGGVAHDVHGKNNHKEGSLGQHIEWLELIVNNKILSCSREKNPQLFHASIAGLGLTGFITRVALRLKKAPRFVQVEHRRFDNLTSLLKTMQEKGLAYDYQIAWLDLLNAQHKSILSLAKHCDQGPLRENKRHSVPPLPFSLIGSWNMKWFNRLYWQTKKEAECLSLEAFNNPLDSLGHWNRLYGPRGLIQFQALFSQEEAAHTLNHLEQLIQTHKATPSLAVLKLFQITGEGLLSFCRPGYTLAVDFVNNSQAIKAIQEMNHYVVEQQGGIYLAKDLLLNSEQFQKLYPKHQEFSQILRQHQCSMHSDLAARLGIPL